MIEVLVPASTKRNQAELRETRGMWPYSLPEGRTSTPLWRALGYGQEEPPQPAAAQVARGVALDVGPSMPTPTKCRTNQHSGHLTLPSQ